METINLVAIMNIIINFSIISVKGKLPELKLFEPKLVPFEATVEKETSNEKFGDHKNVDGVCIFVQKIAISPTDRKPCTPAKYFIDTFDVEPYKSLIMDIVKQTLRESRRAENCSKLDVETTNISKLKLGRTSDFTFPFAAYKESPEVHRHHFLPLLDPPGEKCSFYATCTISIL